MSTASSLPSVLRSLLVTLALVTPSVASADVIDPIEEACNEKQAGDECVVEPEPGLTEAMMGTCEPATCTRLDYSNGTPPTVVEYDCLVFTQPSDSSGGTASGGGSSSTGTDSGGTADEEERSCSGCSMSETSLASLGLGLALLVLARRRRGRRSSGPLA